ncbi:MAG: DUF2029 domain-containing protein [Quinella sp. 1Q5]|nr:DUF2029 domain-containing protein [Quinella sp. 1Q5]
MNKNFNLAVTMLSLGCFIANWFMLGELKKLWDAAQIPFFDFHGQWALCAYTLHGIDPYAITGLASPTIKELGIIPAAWSTTPWGLILGNFFYPGFLSLEHAIIYFLIMNFFFLMIMAHFLTKHFYFTLKALPAFLASFLISTHFGNAGAVICCMLILSCLLAEEKPILSGVLLSLAMIKPQVALPICFALLLRKNLKALIVAAVIDLSAWGIAALLTNQTPLTLLTEFLSVDTGGGTAFAGLFTLAFQENLSLAMGLSMLAGVVFVWLTFKDEKYFWACPACLATTFFAYSFHNEFFILVLPALLCIKLARTKSLWLAAFVFMAIAPYVLFLLMKAFFPDSLTVFWLSRTIFAIVLIVIGFLIQRALNCQKIFG